MQPVERHLKSKWLIKSRNIPCNADHDLCGCVNPKFGLGSNVIQAQAGVIRAGPEEVVVRKKLHRIDVGLVSVKG